MAHADTNIVQPAQPDPDRAEPARLDSVGTGKILHLLRTLFAYGRNLVEKLREEDDPNDLPWYTFLTTIFGTIDPAVITVVILRGLLRARALQARLSSSLTRGRAPLLPLPLREGDGGRGPGRDDRCLAGVGGLREGGEGRAPGPRSRRAAESALPADWLARHSSLDRQPSPEEQMYAEIVAKDRDRPIGAILLDICLDLAIVPALMDAATWDELRLAITLHGGDPAPLLADADRLAGATDVGSKPPDSFQEHSATGTPGPNDSPPIAGQPAIVYPPLAIPRPHKHRPSFLTTNDYPLETCFRRRLTASAAVLIRCFRAVSS
jgi:hypothetical protein